MRRIMKAINIKPIAVLVGLGLGFISGASYSDSVWEFLSDSEHEDILGSIDTPANAFSAVAVDISLEYLETLGSADEIEIRLSEATALNFSISDVLGFPNGDRGWHGANNAGVGLQTLSMTAGRTYFLASVVTQENTYKVIAKKQAGQESYIGWLYQEIRQAPQSINDMVLEEDQTRAGPRRSAALDSPAINVVVSAVLEDEYYVFVDKDLVWKFTVENPLETETKSLILSIGGRSVENPTPEKKFIDHSELFDLPGNCQEAVYEDSDPFRKTDEITCSLDPIAANSSVSITIKSRLKPGLSADSLILGGLGFPSSALLEAPITFLGLGSYDGYFSGPIPVIDVLTDTDADGISDFNENLLGTDSNDKDSGAPRDVVIDVAVLYTSTFKNQISVDPETQINSAFTSVNEMYKGSNTGVKFNIVHYELLDYVNNCTAERCTPEQTWNDTLTVMAEYGDRNENQWRFSEKIRALKGADFIAIIDGKSGADPTLGLARSGTGNRGYFGFNKHNRTMFSHYDEDLSDNSNLTIAHELGHLLGISHSRKQSRDTFGINESLLSTFPWAAGHGVQDKFVTIMPYPDKFGFAGQIARFSDASRMDCDYPDPITLTQVLGAACGIARTDIENGADAVAAMKTVRYQHELFSPSRPILPTVASDGKTYATKFLAGAIKDIELGFRTEFLPGDKINAEGTINIAPEHVGEIGTTHIVLDGGALGAFQLDSGGNFVPFDLAAPVLVGSISPRALKSVETLPVFNDLAFADLGLTSATLNVFFGYTVSNENIIVYTGSPLVINVASQ